VVCNALRTLGRDPSPNLTDIRSTDLHRVPSFNRRQDLLSSRQSLPTAKHSVLFSEIGESAILHARSVSFGAPQHGKAIMASPRDPSRLRPGLNLLTTNSLAPNTYGNHVNSPMSAVSMASPFIQSAQTPSSAIQPYNPQEWVPSPAQMPDRSRQFPVDGGQGTGI
jgi:hypothetical protein